MSEAKIVIRGRDETRDAVNSAVGNVRRIKGSVDDVAKSISDFKSKFESALQIAGVATAVQGIKSIGGALIETQIALDRINGKFSAVFGKGAGQDLEFVRRESAALGLVFADTASAYASFAAATKGTSLEGAKTRQIFTDMAAAAKSLGISTEDVNGILTALGQIASKGTVQAEELKGQIGDRLPGAMQAAAKAMGVTTAQLMKMMEQGEIVATDFLPRFAKQVREDLGGAAEESAKNMESAVNRLSSSWADFKRSVVEGGPGDFMKDAMKRASTSLQLYSEALDASKAAGDGFIDTAVRMVQARLGVGDFAQQPKLLAVQISLATKELQDLERQAEKTGNSKAFAKQIAEAEAYLVRLQLIQAQQQAPAFDAKGAAESDAHIMRQASELKAQEEARGKRLAGIADITAKLRGETTEYAKNLKALKESYEKGDFVGREKEYRELLAKNEKIKPKVAGEAAVESQQDQVLKRKLDGRVKAIKDAQDEERALIEFAERYFSGLYEDGKISLADFYSEKERLRAQGLNALKASLDAEIRAQEEYKAKARRPQDKIEADNRIQEAEARKAKAEEEARRKQIEDQQERERQMERTRQRIQEVSAELKDLEGDAFGAAMDRARREAEETAKTLKQAGADTGLADRMRVALENQAKLNEIQRQFGEISTLNQSMEGKGVEEILAARRTQMTQLQDLIEKTKELSAVSADPKILLFLEQLKSSYRELQASVEPLAGARAAITDYMEQAARAGDATRDLVSRSMSSMEDTIVQGLVTGKDMWRQWVDQVIAEILRLTVVRPLIAGIMGALTGGTGTSGALAGAAASYGGARATGGGVSSGNWYVVGEKGPEVFAPKTSGTIIPNHALGAGASGGATIVQHNTFSGDMDQVAMNRFAKQVQASTEAAILRSKKYGGAHR